MRKTTAALLVVSLLFLGGSSCLLDPVEEPTSTTATDGVATTAATTAAAPSDAAPPPTTAAAVADPTTTTSPPETTTTPAPDAFPTEVIFSYLRSLLKLEVDISRLVEEMNSISSNWDNRSETEATYEETEAGLDSAVQNMQSAGADFNLIQPPPTAGYPAKHLTVASAVAQILSAAEGMLEGIRSTDAGEQRQSAQVAMRAAAGVLAEGIDDVITEYIGDEEITDLIVSREMTVAAPEEEQETEEEEEEEESPATTTTTTAAPETTTTTAAPETTTTTAAPETTTTTAAPTTTTTQPPDTTTTTAG